MRILGGSGFQWRSSADHLNSSFEFLRLDPGRIDSDKERVLFGGVFDGLWFEFPTPFQKGDIVWNPDQP